MQHHFRRITALLLCLLIVLSALPFTALAAEQTVKTSFSTAKSSDGKSICYHAKFTWKGNSVGSTSGKGIRTIIYANGKEAYCIQPGVTLNTNDKLTLNNSSAWNALTDAQKNAVKLALLCGRPGNSANLSGSKGSQYTATLMLVWEFVCECRNPETLERTSDSVYNAFCRGGNNAEVSKVYNEIVTAMNNYALLPSLAQPSVEASEEFEVSEDETGWCVSIEDTSGVLKDFTITCDDPSAEIAKHDNLLTVRFAEKPAKETLLTLIRDVSVSTDSYLAVYGKSNRQDVVLGVERISDVIGYARLVVLDGDVEVVKTSEDGKVSGIGFTLSGNGISQTVATDSQGVARFEGILAGDYTITEAVMSGYNAVDPIAVTVTAGETSHVAVHNTIARGNLKVQKISEDGNISGIRFLLTGTSMLGERINMSAVTDENGIAVFENIPISGERGYELAETDVPNIYVRPENQTVIVRNDQTTNVTFENRLKRFRVSLKKQDAENGTAQGSASLAGAVYGLFKDDALVAEYTTDANGAFTTADHPCGEGYVIRELRASEGYLLDENRYAIPGADYSEEAVQLYNIGSNEQIIKGKIALVKHSDNGDTQIETPEVGASFTVYPAGGSYDSAPANERDTLVCDENGYAESKALPYGVYTVHQLSGSDGAEQMSDFTVMIAENGKVYRFIINNAPYTAYLRVVKKDAETGKTIPMQGAAFQIYDASGNRIGMTITYPTAMRIDTFCVGADGMLTTPQVLPMGDYTLVEVQAPYGYLLDSEPIPFTVSADTVVEIEIPMEAEEVISEEPVQEDTPQDELSENEPSGNELSENEEPMDESTEETIPTDEQPTVETVEEETSAVEHGEEESISEEPASEESMPEELVSDEPMLLGLLDIFGGTAYAEEWEVIEIHEETEPVTEEINVGEDTEPVNNGEALEEIIEMDDTGAIPETKQETEAPDPIPETQTELPECSIYDLMIEPFEEFVEEDNIYYLNADKVNVQWSVDGKAQIYRFLVSDEEGELIGDFSTEYTAVELDITGLLPDTLYMLEIEAIPAEGYTAGEVMQATMFVKLSEETEIEPTLSPEPPEETEEPIATEEPIVTEEPVATEEPIVTEEPIATEAPVVTEEPVVSEEPVIIDAPVVTDEPETSVEPETTAEPSETEVPEATVEPEPTDAPEATEQPTAGSDWTINAVTVNVSDMPQKGRITVYKTGEVFSSVVESGEALKTYLPVFEQRGLPNVTFNIYAAETIRTGDNTVRYESGACVSSMTTDADGVAVSDELYLGKYILRETETPIAFVLSSEDIPVQLSYAGQTVQAAATSVSVTNVRKKLSILLNKAMEDAEGNTVLAVSFGLFARENLIAANGDSIPADGLIEIAFCDANGDCSFASDLPLGSYYVKELTTDARYRLDETVYEVDFTHPNSEMTVFALNGGEPIVNHLKRGHIEGIKIESVNGTGLEGALIGLFKADETDLTEENALSVIMSDSNGSFAFENLTMGTYLVCELAAPEGYRVSKDVFSFTLTEDGQTESCELVNSLLTGGVELVKLDSRNAENRLSGAVFTVYDGTNNAVNTLTELTDCRYVLDGLTYGEYTLVETQAPTGFVRDDKAYPFSITEDGVRVLIENEIGTGFANRPIRGSITISKSGTDGKLLIGAGYKVLNANGNVVAQGHTDENGKLSFTLDYGEYVVQEYEAPEGYVLDETPYSFSITEDGQHLSVDLANTQIVGTLQISKIDASTEMLLPNAGFRIYDLNNEVLLEGRTDKNGICEFSLPYGSYFYQELDAPEGYLIDDTVYPFSVTENGEVISVVMTNRKERGTLKISKADMDTDALLPNAGFRIYDSKNNVITEGYTDENGIAEFELDVGSYFYQEFDAPEGYVIDDTKYEFTLTEDGQVLSEKMTNRLKSGTVTLTKLDASTKAPLSGAKFRVFDADGKVVLEGVTDENGIWNFELKYGKYSCREYESPKGYALNEQKCEFSITEDRQKFSIRATNSKLGENPDKASTSISGSSAPKTGDDNNLHMALMGAGVCFIIAILCIAFGRKRRNRAKRR